MAYNDFSESSLTAEERVAEAQRIVSMIGDLTDMMTPTERSFVERMGDGDYCSVKQLFWLRDIKDKYL